MPHARGAPRRGASGRESPVSSRRSAERGAIALVGAQPEDGVVVRVKDQGPEQLVVAFAGDDGGPVTVVATLQRRTTAVQRLRHCLAGSTLAPDPDRLRWRRDERV